MKKLLSAAVIALLLGSLAFVLWTQKPSQPTVPAPTPAPSPVPQPEIPQPIPPVPPLPPTEPKPVPPPTVPPTQTAGNCGMVEESIALQYAVKKADGSYERGTYNLKMPVTKKVAHEAHYLIEGKDPPSVSDMHQSLDAHLKRTCALLHGAWAVGYPGLSADCHEIYSGGGANEWTPAEGGGVGRGNGARYPSTECEAATGNMYWAKGASPKPGTRFIAKHPTSGKAFVMCFGYEAGPGSPQQSGGLGTEALYYLGGKHNSVMVLGRAVDQTLPYGPITCK